MLQLNKNKVREMKKIALIFLFIVSSLFAKEDYSEMSTQELIAIIGYVKDANKDSFIKELNSRISTMTEDERNLYKETIEKLDQNEK
jgi:hypothetical protein